jgi:putative cardiolipin synthase
MSRNKYSLFLVLLFLNFSVQARAEFIKLLDDNNATAQAKIDIIQQAKNEIRFEYFTVGSVKDEYTLQTFALLRQAAKRGVKVKILLDGGNVRISRAVIEALIETSENNLEFRLFNIINPFKPSSISQRDHTKAVNVDNKILLTGDRNVSCQYISDCDVFQNHFKSVDVLIGGKIVQQEGDIFDQLWGNAAFVQAPHLFEYAADKRFAPCYDGDCTQIEQRQRAVEKEIQAASLTLDSSLKNSIFKADTHTDWLIDGFEHNNVQLLFDDPNRAVSATNRQMSDQLGKIIAENVRPGSQLTILSPYLIPTPEILKFFQALLAHHVHIKIITNSLASTDNIFAQAGYSKYKLMLIAIGLEIWEYNGFDESYRSALTSHAKCAVIDNRVGILGSYNIDNRSQQINREMGIAVIDNEAETTNLNRPTFPKKLLHVIEEFQSHSTLVGINGAPTADVYKLESDKQKLGELHAVAFFVKLFGLEGLL